MNKKRKMMTFLKIHGHSAENQYLFVVFSKKNVIVLVLLEFFTVGNRLKIWTSAELCSEGSSSLLAERTGNESG